MKNHLFTLLLTLAALATVEVSFGQAYKVINYECLETPLVLLNANHDNTVTYCNNGLVQVDTLEEDCYEFYTEDQNIFRGWFYNSLDDEGNVAFDFDRITFHEDEEWTGIVSKYFELQRAGFWLTLPSMENPQRQLSIHLKDLSEGGINIGFLTLDGPMYFPRIEDILNADFPDLDISLEGETLNIQGSFRNMFIGGDHLYLGSFTLSELLTPVETIGGIDIQFYPNPTADLINISSKALTGAVVKVYTATGVLYTTQFSQREQIGLDVSGLASGVFWVQIWKNNQLLHTQTMTKF